jgi:hypothetical protein
MGSIEISKPKQTAIITLARLPEEIRLLQTAAVLVTYMQGLLKSISILNELQLLTRVETVLSFTDYSVFLLSFF